MNTFNGAAGSNHASAALPGSWPALALVFILVADSLRPQDSAAAPVVVKTGKHYVLSCHGGDEQLAQKALDAVEAAWPIVIGVLHRTDNAPPQPLPVHLYRTIEGYEAADQQLTQGKFQRNLAMTDWATRSAHVALQPPCSDEALRAIGLPGQTAVLLAWEACHLARHRLCPTFPDHPHWFEDGLASWVASQVLENLYPSGRGDAAPFFTTAMATVQRLEQDARLPSATHVLADHIDDLDFNDRYAAREVFFRFLCVDSNKDKLGKIVDAIVRTGGGSKYREQVLAAATKILGTTLDKDFAQFVDGLKPGWQEVFRSLTVAGQQWTQMAFPDKNAIAWNTELVKGGGLSVAGDLRILPGEGKQLNFLFARTDAGFYSIAFTADVGFTVFDYQAKTNNWAEIGNANAPGLRLGYGSTFAIAGTGQKLVVHLDKLEWTFQLPRALPPDVQWGVGAQQGSAGLWSDIKVGPARN
ncbi:MAG TPA: hypothetical protein VK348_06810 [Planctomycetota bacterium]|nr:hypothetical protein [Planctomycetota bacterium]